DARDTPWLNADGIEASGVVQPNRPTCWPIAAQWRPARTSRVEEYQGAIRDRANRSGIARSANHTAAKLRAPNRSEILCARRFLASALVKPARRAGSSRRRECDVLA